MNWKMHSRSKPNLFQAQIATYLLWGTSWTRTDLKIIKKNPEMMNAPWIWDPQYQIFYYIDPLCLWFLSIVATICNVYVSFLFLFVWFCFGHRPFDLFYFILGSKSQLFTAEAINLPYFFPSICIRTSPVCQKLYFPTDRKRGMFQIWYPRGITGIN